MQFSAMPSCILAALLTAEVAWAGGSGLNIIVVVTHNSYSFSELPFPEAQPDTALTNSFLAMMLTASNLAGAELILNRGLASDSSFPTQTVYLEKTSDTARNVRYVEFDNALLDSRVR